MATYYSTRLNGHEENDGAAPDDFPEIQIAPVPLPPAPPWLFYLDDSWRFVPAPPGSVPITAREGKIILDELLDASEPTTIPEHFVGAIHARPCRVWTHVRDQKEYGLYFLPPTRSRILRAHRARLVVRDGCYPPEDIFARHLCNNPPCIEVSHLAWGSREQNFRDRAMQQGREWLKQVRSGNLAPAIATEIRIAAIVYGLDSEGIRRLTGLPLEAIDELLSQEFVAL